MKKKKRVESNEKREQSIGKESMEKRAKRRKNRE